MSILFLHSTSYFRYWLPLQAVIHDIPL